MAASLRSLPTALATTALLLAGAAPARAYDAGDLTRTLTHEMHLAGAASGAYVRDLDTGRQLFALRENVPRIPASVEKLYTTSTALLRLGPATTLNTTVVPGGPVDALGVLRGDLFIVGHGDPFFAAIDARRLASAVRAAGIRRIDGAIVGDESYFDARRSGVAAGYDPELGGVLSALSFERGFARGRPRLDTARYAAQQFARALRADGVTSARASRAGTAPPGTASLVSAPSLPVRALIRYTNVPSNNFAAEMLLKAVGARAGDGGTTSAGAAVVRSTLGSFGVRPRVLDGSGLSRADRTTPREVVRLLQRMDDQDVAASFRASLPTAGSTGTLADRMRGSSAAGRCHAKTGTLHDVSGLAGYCRTVGGRNIAFAFLMNHVDPDVVRPLQDAMTEAIARLPAVGATGPTGPTGGTGTTGAKGTTTGGLASP